MKRRIFGIILLCVLLMLTGLPVSADMGPKPSVTVHVLNPPAGTYYLDLMQTYGGIESSSAELLDPNDEMEQTLRAYRDGNWRPRMEGTSGPLTPYGWITMGETHTCKFDYMIPETFRIIIVTEELAVISSNPLSPERYFADVIFDAESGELYESTQSIAEKKSLLSSARLRVFCFTCLVTVLTEAAVLALCRLELDKHDWCVFAGTQIVTQILLYLWLEHLTAGLLLAEPLIWAAELTAYLLLMHTQKRKKLVLAAIAANAVSYALTAVTGDGLLIWLSQRT